MTKKEDRIIDLTARVIASQATAEDLDELNEILSGDDGEAALLIQRMIEECTFFNEWTFDSADWQQKMDRILQADKETTTEIVRPAPQHVVRPMRRWRWAAAAAVLFLVASMAYMLTTGIDPQRKEASQPSLPNDIAAGREGAILTLADGSEVQLAKTAGRLIEQGSATLINGDGRLEYTSEGGKDSRAVLNTLYTPRGRTYRLVLGDGTLVWLNAQSSIRFPTAFGNQPRKVEITGEVYFEVAKATDNNGQRVPFLVTSANATTEVIGTHFNINSYDDEESVKVTLLEGRVKVSSNGKSVLLAPGQQAQVATEEATQIKVLTTVNTEEVVGWKNGMFVFKGADLETVLRQAARWYDVEVEFRRQTDAKFYGEVTRNTSLSNLLKALTLSGNVNLSIQGRKIIVE